MNQRLFHQRLLLACSLLMVNNIRDLDTDRRAGKRTLAVRLGRARMRHIFSATLLIAFVTLGIVPTWAQLAGLAVVMLGFWLALRR